MRKTQDRALHHRRTEYKPGFGLCGCPVCRKAVDMAQEDPHHQPRYGSQVEGCQHVNPELAFAEAWEKECRPRPGLNYGNGLVQDLMVVHRPGERQGLFSGGRMAFWLTPRERVICASVVQWLGTSCGMAFLGEVLTRCGYKISRDPEKSDLVKLLKKDLRAAQAKAARVTKDARDSAERFQSLLDQLNKAGIRGVGCTEDILREVLGLAQSLAEARAMLSRLNLDPAPDASATSAARFIGLDEGDI